MPAGIDERTERRNESTLLSDMTDRLPLRDGSVLLARPIQQNDVERLRAFHQRLSRDAIIFRFFHYVPELSEGDARHFTHLDYENRMALVATEGSGPDERIVGVVRYERVGADTAEVAFVVEDRWQGRGISTALLHRLARYARRHGITQFVAITMGSNIAMLDVFRHAGYPWRLRFEGGEYAVELDIHQSVPFEARSLAGQSNEKAGAATDESER